MSLLKKKLLHLLDFSDSSSSKKLVRNQERDRPTAHVRSNLVNRRSGRKRRLPVYEDRDAKSNPLDFELEVQFPQIEFEFELNSSLVWAETVYGEEGRLHVRAWRPLPDRKHDLHVRRRPSGGKRNYRSHGPVPTRMPGLLEHHGLQQLRKLRHQRRQNGPAMAVQQHRLLLRGQSQNHAGRIRIRSEHRWTPTPASHLPR